MRARYVALVVAVLPSFAAAQGRGSLCNPCVDPPLGAPRQFHNVDSVSGSRSITAADMQRLGLVGAADMLAQLPSNVRVEGGFSLDAVLAEQGVVRALVQLELAPPLIYETAVTAPVESVWRAWTTSAGLSAWLAPLADVELRIGGKLRVAFDPAAGLGGVTAVENEILAYDAPRMLAFRVKQSPASFPYVDAAAAMWTVVYLDAEGSNATRVRVVVNGLGSDEEVRAFFARGYAETLRRLEARFGMPE